MAKKLPKSTILAQKPKIQSTNLQHFGPKKVQSTSFSGQIYSLQKDWPPSVKEAWQWVRNKVVELLGTLGPPPVVSNKEIVLAMFPKSRQETEVIFILGNYLQLVDEEVMNKQKVLRVDSMLGVLKAKMEFIKSRAVPQLCLTLQ